MNRIRPAAVGAAAVCAIGLAAPAAFASSGGSAAQITLTPSSMRTGATVSIEVDCTAYNAPHPSGVSSAAFSTSVLLHPVPGSLGRFSAAATIHSAIKPGSYTVAGSCMSNGESTAAFESVLVISRNDDPKPAPDPEKDPVTGPVRTGVGGSTSSGSPAQIAIGASLVVGAGGAALWRRRRQSDAGSGGGS